MSDCQVSKGHTLWSFPNPDEVWENQNLVTHTEVVRLRGENLDIEDYSLDDNLQPLTTAISQVDVPLRTWSTSIFELGDDAIILKHPLIVTIEDYGDDEFTASWPEVEAFASGATESEAINDLKDEIVALFRELSTMPDNELGKLPKRWKRALNSAISQGDCKPK